MFNIWIFSGEWVDHEKVSKWSFVWQYQYGRLPLACSNFFFCFHFAALDLHIANSIHTVNSMSQRKQRQVLKYPYFQDGSRTMFYDITIGNIPKLFSFDTSKYKKCFDKFSRIWPEWRLNMCIYKAKNVR